MIRGAVALDPEDVTALLVAMHYAYINPVFGGAHLRMRVIPFGFQPCEEPALKVTAWRICDASSRRYRSPRPVIQKLLQHPHALGAPICNDLPMVEAGEDRQLALVADKESLQAPMRQPTVVGSRASLTVRSLVTDMSEIEQRSPKRWLSRNATEIGKTGKHVKGL
jgi:hypothetical protein